MSCRRQGIGKLADLHACFPADSLAMPYIVKRGSDFHERTEGGLLLVSRYSLVDEHFHDPYMVKQDLWCCLSLGAAVTCFPSCRRALLKAGLFAAFEAGNRNPTVARLQGGTPVSFANIPMSMMYIFFPAQASSFPGALFAPSAPRARSKRLNTLLRLILPLFRAPAFAPGLSLGTVQY